MDALVNLGAILLIIALALPIAIAAIWLAVQFVIGMIEDIQDWRRGWWW